MSSSGAEILGENAPMEHDLERIVREMNSWFVAHNFRGNDPYQMDEKYLGFSGNTRYLQFLRKLLKPFHAYIPKKLFTSFPDIYHPKALGLIISGNVMLCRLTGDEELLRQNEELAGVLEEIRSPGYDSLCWGHPFEWGQNPRYPANTPAVCVVCPVAQGLLDHYEITGDPGFLEMCEDAADYLLEENGMDEVTDDQTALFYTPLDRKYVYNAIIQASAFLYRLCEHTDGNERRLDLAGRTANFVVRNQREDGSWHYADKKGAEEIRRIDNRHTGFILEALSLICRYHSTPEYEQSLQSGTEYYLKHFFEDGLPKWSDTRMYPIDIHDVAQAIITLTALGEYFRAERVAEFAVENMSDGTDEFYYKYYQSGRVNWAVFIRWNQAWMYRALTYYLRFESDEPRKVGESLSTESH